MNNMSRQDFVAVTEGAKNKIIERLVTKYDVQAAADSARDRILANINTLRQENQVMTRQSNAQRDQTWRRITALEGEFNDLKREIQLLRETILKSVGQPVNTEYSPY